MEYQGGRKEMIDVNELILHHTISCPVCKKGKLFSYGQTKGLVSSRCEVCGRTILWNLEDGTAQHINNRKIKNR